MANLSNGFVCLMGMGTVFIGLICIVFLCQAMSAIIKHFEKGPEVMTLSAKQVSGQASETSAPIENRQELVAAISAVLAEELGEEVTALRILSIKKI